MLTSGPRNASDHTPVGVALASGRVEGRGRGPRFVALRPLRDGDGDLDANIVAQCRAGVTRGNKPGIAARTDILANHMVGCAAPLPRHMRPIHTGVG